jgi:8-oxo-dGTP pyrophosphatase MutT (NUDIX family)
MNSDETAIEAALREFYEESGCEIANAWVSSVTEVLQNANFTLVECDISSTRLGQIQAEASQNVGPNLGGNQPLGAFVQDWEFGHCQIVKAPQLPIYLGAPRPVPIAEFNAVLSQPPHTQSVDWYGTMANALLDF